MSFKNLFGAIALAAAAGTATAVEHTKDTPAEVKKALENKSAVLLDVREQDEWDEGHLKDAKLIPLSRLKKAGQDATRDLPKDRVIYTHCKSGKRSLMAAELLEKMGYKVKPLKEGYEDLLKAGFPKAGK